MYKSKKLVSLLLIFVMMLSLVPAVNAAETIDVTFSVLTDTIAADPSELGEEPILTQPVTVTVPGGASVLDVLNKAAEENNFTVSASGMVTKIGWAEDKIYGYEIYDGMTFGGWTYWVDGKAVAVGANDCKLDKDCSLTWRFSVVGPDFAVPTYDVYPDFEFVDAYDALKGAIADAKAADPAEYDQTQKADLDAKLAQSETCLNEIDQAVAASGGRFAYFWEQQDEDVMSGTIYDSADKMTQLAYDLRKAINREVPVTGLSLNKTFVMDLQVGNTFTLVPAIEPENATNQQVTYSVDDESILSVDENGVVTGLKNDVGIVTVTSVDNPEISKNCTFMVQPRPAAAAIAITPDSAKLSVGEQKTLTLSPTPANADISGVIWSVESGSNVVSVSADGKVTALSDGNAAVKAELGSLSATASITVESTSAKLDTAVSGAAGWITENGFTDLYETGDDWDIFALSRSGFVPDADAQFHYITALNEYIGKNGLALPSDYARAALSLNALGLDAENFGGRNLIEALYNSDNMSTQGINGYVYALLALDSKAYDVPANALWNREKLIDAVIALQKEEGYFVVQDAWGVDNDLTAAVVQALAPYYSQEKVKLSVDKALTWLKENQSDNAGYESWGSENSQTPAQVITALCALGRNPLTDNGFIKQNHTLLDNVLSFANEDGGFDFSPDYPGSNSMATQQVLYSLSALKRYLDGENRLYDLTDADTKAGTELLTKLSGQISEAKTKMDDTYTAATLKALKDAIANAEKVTENSSKSELFNAVLQLSSAVDNLQKSVPIGDGTIVIDSTEPSYIEPSDAATPLAVTIEHNSEAYLELNAVSENCPQVQVQNDTSSLLIGQGTKVSSQKTNLLLPQKQALPNQEISDNLNALLRDSNLEVDSLKESVKTGEGVSFDQYATLRFSGCAGKQAAYSSGDRYYLISSSSSDEAGQQSGKAEYAYSDGADLVIRTKHLDTFTVFSAKSTGGGSGGGSDTTQTASVTVTANTIGKGTIFNKKSFQISNSETPYSLLVKALGQSMIETTGSGSGIYVTAIKHNNEWIRELQYGAGSGWMYKINGEFIQKSASAYQLKAGDNLEWIYTRDIGGDIGGSVGGGGGGSVNASPSPSISPSPSQKPVDNTYKATLNEINGKLSEKDSLSEWEIFALSISGKVPSNVQELAGSVTEAGGNYRKVTDLERNALALSAAGLDITNLNGINLIEKIVNHENMTMQGTNGPAYALVVLDSKGYDDGGGKWSRDSLIETILSAQNTDGGFALEPGKESNIDVTAMVLQAFSAYQDRASVKTASDKALSYLSQVQNADGGYTLFGDENSESVSQVILALTSLGIDPKADSRFIKNGKSTVDALLSYYENGAFRHSKDGEFDQIATEQGLLALLSYDMLLNGGGKLFDLSSTQNGYRDIGSASGWAVDAIQKAEQYGIMQGYDGYFNPQNTLTRAEFTAVMVRMLKLETSSPENPFTDLSSSDWYYQDVTAAYQAGFIKGQSDDTFAPLANISREEMAVILNRVLSLESTETEIKDIDSVSAWAQDSVKAVFTSGIMQGYDKNFNPHDNVTREMAAVVCVRIYENFLKH